MPLSTTFLTINVREVINFSPFDSVPKYRVYSLDYGGTRWSD